ncbi:stage III sporulation protein AA [Effusibacillus dendaii]|uniref:Stage III sporulation protein AA n=1 Tax=Effusibacillus dendaii TaxID=2743772 RepID=A0A7I8DBN3_9BACL|nr:stage III sporulation protein AA [Effusibacillus dendaii]BCJ85930.1 stage III sporulation protein AA [Effusibacillus dendaii]
MIPTNLPNEMEPVIQEQILPVLAPTIRNLISKVPSRYLKLLEEIRIRQEKPLQMYTHANDFFVDSEGLPVQESSKAYRVTEEDVAQTIQLLTRSSLYALEEELRRGYLTIAGGHRVGLTGKTVLSPDGFVQTLKQFSGLNIRIARQIPGAADSIKPYIVNPLTQRLCSSLIISPPQCGKTTLLRDLARQISDGILHPKLRGLKVGIVDERSELAGSVNGVAQHAIGCRTDVLDGCPKAEGMLMMIRSMSPDVLITDEVGREEDRDAIREAVHAGVTVIASAHGVSLQEVCQRPALQALFDTRSFERYIVLSRRAGPITLETVHDNQGNCLYERKGRLA